MLKKLRLIGVLCTIFFGAQTFHMQKAGAVAGVVAVSGNLAAAKTIAIVAGVAAGSLLGLDVLWMAASAITGNSDGILGGLYYLVIPAGVGFLIILDQETGMPIIGELDYGLAEKLKISAADVDAFNLELPVVNAVIQNTYFEIEENDSRSLEQLGLDAKNIFVEQITPETQSVLQKLFASEGLR